MAFTRAIEINDRILNAFVGLAVAQQATGKQEDARVSLEQASAIEPNSTLLFSEVSRLQLKVAAAKQRRRYLAPDQIAQEPGAPSDERVVSMIEKQIAHLREAVAEHPNHADLHYRLGLLLKHTGDRGATIQSFERALSINPNYLKAMIKLAIVQREAGRVDDAIRTAQRALQIDPESVQLHYELGLMYADRGLFANAIDSFDEAVRFEPHNTDYVANLALALQNMGLADRAAATWHTLCDLTDRKADAMPKGGTNTRIAIP
jgi:tetratricopeptide (TPR) repeat protein